MRDLEDGEPDASGLADELWLAKIEERMTPVVWQMRDGCLR